MHANTSPLWRVIELDTHSAAMNMAIDQAVLESVSKNKSCPTIRFYQWLPSAVSIGYFQSLSVEVNEGETRKRGFDVVRRQTGGGAVFHDSAGEITYSIIGKEELFSKGITESYHEICDILVKGLGLLGIPAEFKPINDIIVKGKKISGNAQTRRNGVLLQHGTILYDLDVETMFSVLRITNEKISDKLIASVKDRVTRILDHADISKSDCYSAFQEAFCKNRETYIGKLSLEEQIRTTELVRDKYGSDEWNRQR